MPPRKSKTDIPVKKSQKPQFAHDPKLSQAFRAPKGKRTKDIIQKNATESPLLRLPREIRDRIWKHLIGDRLVHIARPRITTTKCQLFHSVCEAPVTEPEAYDLSKAADYDMIAERMKPGEDMRFCFNRHCACYKALHTADARNHPANRLPIEIMLACRQAYVEVQPILWATTIWSFHDALSWREWLNNRNTQQKRFLKKVHLAGNVVADVPHLSVLVKFKPLDALHVDITTDCQFRSIYQFFSAPKVSAICYGREIQPMVVTTSSRSTFTEENGGLTWRQRGERADACESHLLDLAQIEEEKQKALAEKKIGRKRKKMCE